MSFQKQQQAQKLVFGSSKASYRKRSAASNATQHCDEATLLLLPIIYQLWYTRCCTQFQILQSRVLASMDSYFIAENRIVKVANIPCCTNCYWPSLDQL